MQFQSWRGPIRRWPDGLMEDKSIEDSTGRNRFRGEVEATVEFLWLFLFRRHQIWHKRTCIKKQKRKIVHSRQGQFWEWTAGKLTASCLWFIAYRTQMFLCIIMCADTAVCVFIISELERDVGRAVSILDSWCRGTLCALLHNHQFKYQKSGKDTEMKQCDFLSYHDSL